MRASILITAVVALLACVSSAAPTLSQDPDFVSIRVTFFDGSTVTCRAVDQKKTASGTPFRMPGADGTLLFTGSGVFSADLKLINADTFRNLICMPTYSPAYFLGVRLNDGFIPNRNASRPKLTVYSTGDRAALFTLPDIPEFSGLDRQKVMFGGAGSLPLSQRIHLMPGSNLLVTIPDTRDSVMIRTFDLTKELEKSGVDYLFVSSTPVRHVARGGAYSYPIEARSRRGGVKYKLESGPAGMTLAVDGKLQWKVPMTFPDATTSVIVTVSDASGQEVYHSFNITLDPGNPIIMSE